MTDTPTNGSSVVITTEEDVRSALARALAKCGMTREEYDEYVATNRCGSCCPPDDLNNWGAWNAVGDCLFLLGEDNG